jgi:hypothetical protein
VVQGRYGLGTVPKLITKQLVLKLLKAKMIV